MGAVGTCPPCTPLNPALIFSVSTSLVPRMPGDAKSLSFSFFICFVSSISFWPFPVVFTNLGLPGVMGGPFITTLAPPPESTYVALLGSPFSYAPSFRQRLICTDNASWSLFICSVFHCIQPHYVKFFCMLFSDSISSPCVS